MRRPNACARSSKTRRRPLVASHEPRAMSAAPQVTRVVHELKRRRLTVARVEKLAPGMRRVVLRGKELAGFTSLGFDDHVKLFFFNAGVTEMRDFTPRRFD